MMLGLLYAIIQQIRHMISQRRHLTEKDIKDFSINRIDKDSLEYGRIIAHLASCEECQEELRAFQKISQKAS